MTDELVIVILRGSLDNASASSIFGIIVVASLYVIFFFVAAHRVGRYVIRYRLDDAALSINLFGRLPFISIRYASIAVARVLQFGEAWSDPTLMFGAIKLGNRLYAPRFVVIRRAEGLFHQIIITPDDPDGFTQDLMHRVVDARICR